MDAAILDLWSKTLITLAMVAGPFVLVALAVGLLVSIVQAATQLQENVLAFAPKVIATGLLLALAGHWFLDQLVVFMREVAQAAIHIGQSGGP
jgi:flagellar biosynthetic protein FliQ